MNSDGQRGQSKQITAQINKDYVIITRFLLDMKISAFLFEKRRQSMQTFASAFVYVCCTCCRRFGLIKMDFQCRVGAFGQLFFSFTGKGRRGCEWCVGTWCSALAFELESPALSGRFLKFLAFCLSSRHRQKSRAGCV